MSKDNRTVFSITVITIFCVLLIVGGKSISQKNRVESTITEEHHHKATHIENGDTIVYDTVYVRVIK